MGRYKPSQSYPTVLPEGEAFSFDPGAFDDAIRSQGVMVEHWVAMRCPVGMVDRHDTLRRPHEHHENCSNGFIYTKAGTFQALLSGNNLQSESRDQGTADSSSCAATFPRFYAESEEKRIYVAPYDRLYYSDDSILVPQWEICEAHITGRDRLSFPPVEILNCVDSRGVRYSDSDFEIVANQLRWRGQRQPGQDPETGKGIIFSCRYLYRPYWYVRSLAHEIRVTQIEDALTGERRLEKMPQAAQLQREYMFLNEERGDEDSGSARQQRQPQDASFNPR